MYVENLTEYSVETVDEVLKLLLQVFLFLVKLYTLLRLLCLVDSCMFIEY